MIRRTRRYIAFSGIALLLFVQGPQALAACVCDMPSELKEMCGSSSPDAGGPEPRGCCSTPPVESPDRCGAPSAPDEDRVSISTRCCEKALVVSETLSAATLPTGTIEGAARVASAVRSHPTESVARIAEHRATVGLLRAPPGSGPTPLFLLNAALLI